MTVKKVKFVKKADMHSEYINSSRNTLLFELNEGWNDYTIKTSFNVFHKDESGKKLFVGDVKIGCSTDDPKSVIYVIYDKYKKYVDKNKSKGIELEKLRNFTDGCAYFCSVGINLEYYQVLRILFDAEKEFEDFLDSMGDLIKKGDVGEIKKDEDLFDIVKTSLFRDVSAMSLYALSKYYKKHKIKAYGYQQDEFSKLLIPLKKSNASDEDYEELKKLLSINSYRNKIADQIIISLNENSVDLGKRQIQKLLKYIASDNDFGSKISLDAGKLLEDSDENVDKVVDNIDHLKSLLQVTPTDVKTLKLGHYTSLATLPLLIRESHGEDIPTVRLTNSSQLNDPSEGKILHQYIFGTMVRNYKTPSVYISSATTALDSLPMWKQYADDCKGAVMTYDEEFLQEVLKPSRSSNNKLYQVCYIATDETEDDDIKIEVHGRSEEDIQKIKNLLKSLKKNISSQLSRVKDDEQEFVRDRIEKYLSDIEYLFKNIKYSYEQEYRIVRSPEDEGAEVVAEESGNMPVPLLYAYLKTNDDRKIPVAYRSVCLGPMAIDIDYVEPYVRFISNGKVKVFKSTVDFRDQY